jgi:hypothetical protein
MLRVDQSSSDAAGAVALIGDLVSSREHPDRAALQRALVRALTEVEGLVPSVQPLDVTVGDEFQGAYATLADAVRAALLVRLALLPDIDTRYGLGAGTFTVFDPDRHPVSQDGPAWWAARAAITTAEELAAQARSRGTRTWYARADAPQGSAHPGAHPGAVNAFLSCRDDILARMTPRELRLLRGTLLGRQQAELAQAEGIGQPAVSQALARSGAHTVIATLDLLAQDPPA